MPTLTSLLSRIFAKRLAQRAVHAGKTLAHYLGASYSAKALAEVNPAFTRKKAGAIGANNGSKALLQTWIFTQDIHGATCTVNPHRAKTSSTANTQQPALDCLKLLINKVLYLAATQPLAELYRAHRYALNAHAV